MDVNATWDNTFIQLILNIFFLTILCIYSKYSFCIQPNQERIMSTFLGLLQQPLADQEEQDNEIILLGRLLSTNGTASWEELLARCFLCDCKNTALTGLRLQIRLHCKWSKE